MVQDRERSEAERIAAIDERVMCEKLGKPPEEWPPNPRQFAAFPQYPQSFSALAYFWRGTRNRHPQLNQTYPCRVLLPNDHLHYGVRVDAGLYRVADGCKPALQRFLQPAATRYDHL